jgi:hypothetical protein
MVFLLFSSFCLFYFILLFMSDYRVNDRSMLEVGAPATSTMWRRRVTVPTSAAREAMSLKLRGRGLAG